MEVAKVLINCFKEISHLIRSNESGLTLSETTSNVNQSGDMVKKLDDLTNSLLIDKLSRCNLVREIASEENDNIVKTNYPFAPYFVSIDPLDGSSNIDYNVSVGSIFSIYRRITPRGEKVKNEDFLQEGSKQVAAGYIIYGSSTMLVYSTGFGVNGFTLDPSIGEFCLSHPDIKTPEDGHIYSVNEGNYMQLPRGVKDYIKYCQEKDEEAGRPYTSRYIGSLVSDFHRNLLKGGVFLYPENLNMPGGKLRLVYECNPIAFIAFQAGGAASDGVRNILEIPPLSLHQRSPFYAGSKNMVSKIESFLVSDEHVS